MTQKEILKQAAKELDLPFHDVEDVYMEYWKHIHEKLTKFQVYKDNIRSKFVEEKLGVKIENLGRFIVNATTNKVKEDVQAKKNKATIH